MKKILLLLGQFLEDFLILSGLILLVITTYSLNKTAGSYVLSVIFIVLGVILAKRR